MTSVNGVYPWFGNNGIGAILGSGNNDMLISLVPETMTSVLSLALETMAS